MKTLKRVLCVMLSILMAFSCLSVAASAAGGDKFTSTMKTVTSVSNEQSIKLTLDELDKTLAGLDGGKGIYFPLIEGIIDIDLRDVNGLCKTLDLLRKFLVSDIIIDWLTTEAIKKALGQLGEDINLKNWKTGMKRTKNDAEILAGLIGFIGDNNKVISGFAKGGYDMGVINNVLKDVDELKDILAPGGISKMIKEGFIGFVYDKDSDKDKFAEAYSKYENDMDSFIYGDFLGKIIGDALPGFSIDAGSTIEDILKSFYNLSFDKYIRPAITSMDIDLSDASMPELKKLEGIVNLKGSTYDLSGLVYDENAPLKNQINTILGNYIKNFIPGYSDWVDGGYDKLKGNIENSIKYVAEKSGIVQNASSKTMEQIGVEIAVIILRNGDYGAYEQGLEKCKTLEEMAAALAINIANESKIGVTYTGKESYLVVLGDLLAALAYDTIPFTDTNGKVYRPGGGKDLFEVANYVLNYFLFNRGAAEMLGLSTSKTDSFFTKIDKMVDYFGKDKAVDFNSRNFILGTSGKKGVLECIFKLDLCGLLDLTAIPVLDDIGNVSATEFLYRSVQYFFKSWAGKNVLPEFSAKPFTNALSSSGLGSIIENLLSTIGARKSSVATVISFLNLLSVEGSKTTEYDVSASFTDLVATGKNLTPKVTVKAGGKTLTQGTDYLLFYGSSVKPGTYNATIKGIGLYNGELQKTYKIVMDKISTLTSSSVTTSSVKLSWNSVPYADSYKISVYNTSKKAYETVKSVTGTSYTVTGLSSGKDYKFSVQAVSSAYGSTAAKEISVATVPSAVGSSSLKASATVSSVKLSWSAVSGATHYKVEKYSSKKWSEVTTTSSTSAEISGLTGYTSYTFRVTALKKLSDGSYLAASPVSVTAKTALGTPASITASAKTTSITLKWDKVTNAEKYQLQQYTGGKWKTVKTLTGTSYEIKDLKAATKYKYGVRAVVVEGKSNVYGERKEITQYTLLTKTKGVKAASSSVTSSSAKLSWSKVSKAESYEVYAYISGEWKKMGSTKKTSMTVKGLPSGRKVKLKVRAVAKLGGKTVKGAYSSEVTVQTVVGKVASLKVKQRKRSSISMTWKKTTGATSYQVYRYTNGKWKKIATTKKTTYTDSKSLKKGTEYKYKVRAVQKINSKTTKYGAYSSVLKAKTTVIGTAKR